jgi:hypothetical protein
MPKEELAEYTACVPSGAIIPGPEAIRALVKGLNERLANVKPLALVCSALFVLMFSVDALAGGPMRNLDPSIARPHSMAFGKSLNEWMELHLRWVEDGQNPDERVGNVAFLPIIGESPFEVSVEPGTALVLPVVAWLALDESEILPDEWFGDANHIFGNVLLDGVPIVEPNEAYYVGPTELDPPVFGQGYYQAIVFVATPLPKGQHQIVLHSEFVDFGAEFDNIWLITVEK